MDSPKKKAKSNETRPFLSAREHDSNSGEEQTTNITTTVNKVTRRRLPAGSSSTSTLAR